MVAPQAFAFIFIRSWTLVAVANLVVMAYSVVIYLFLFVKQESASKFYSINVISVSCSVLVLDYSKYQLWNILFEFERKESPEALLHREANEAGICSVINSVGQGKMERCVG